MDTMIPGYIDPVGGRSKLAIVDHTGPKSYTTGGETFPAQSVYGGPNSLGLSGLNWCSGGITESGSYFVVPVFGGGGAVKGTIKLKWLVATSVTGGTFTGTPATLTGTVAAPTITTVNDSGSPTKAIGELTGALSSNGALTGLTGVQAPALTMNSYTPAGTISAATGGGLAEVSAATDLSAEKIRLLVIGG